MVSIARLRRSSQAFKGTLYSINALIHLSHVQHLPFFFAFPLKQKSPRIGCKTERTGGQLRVSRLLMSEGSARQIFVLNSRPEHEQT